jgi:hypothetical protein
MFVTKDSFERLLKVCRKLLDLDLIDAEELYAIINGIDLVNEKKTLSNGIRAKKKFIFKKKNKEESNK